MLSLGCHNAFRLVPMKEGDTPTPDCYRIEYGGVAPVAPVASVAPVEAAGEPGEGVDTGASGKTDNTPDWEGVPGQSLNVEMILDRVHITRFKTFFEGLARKVHPTMQRHVVQILDPFMRKYFTPHPLAIVNAMVQPMRGRIEAILFVLFKYFGLLQDIPVYVPRDGVKNYMAAAVELSLRDKREKLQSIPLKSDGMVGRYVIIEKLPISDGITMQGTFFALDSMSGKAVTLVRYFRNTMRDIVVRKIATDLSSTILHAFSYVDGGAWLARDPPTPEELIVARRRVSARQRGSARQRASAGDRGISSPAIRSRRSE